MHVVVYGGLLKCCHETVTKQGFAEVKELLYFGTSGKQSPLLVSDPTRQGVGYSFHAIAGRQK